MGGGAGLGAFFLVVADVEGRHHEDDVFRHVGGVIANPFEMARDQDQVQGRLDGLGIPRHVPNQFPEHLCLQPVQLIVTIQHPSGQVHVPLDERIERIAQHALRDRGHPRNVDEFLDRGMLQIPLSRLGDVDGQIAHAFEIGVDLDRRDDRPQVDGHRLVQGEQLEAAVVDFDVQAVDRVVADEHAFDQLQVALDEGAYGEPDAVFREATHLEQPGLQDIELVLEMSDVSIHAVYPVALSRIGQSRSLRSASRADW